MQTFHNKFQLLRRLELIRPHLGKLSLGMLMLIVTVGIQLSYPKAVGFFIDNSIVKQRPEWLAEGAILVSVVLLLQAFATTARYYIFASTGSLIVAQLRKKLYGAIVRQEIGFFDGEDVGDLINRLSSDVEQLRDVLTTDLAVFLQALLTGIGAAIMLVLISPKLSLLILILAPIIIMSTRWMGLQVRKNSSLRQAKLASSAHLAQEAFSNIRLVHAFARESTEQEKYAQATDAALSFTVACNRLFAWFQGMGTFIHSAALLITLWYGSRLVAGRSLTIGDLTGFVLYAGMAAGTASTLSALWGEWMRSVGATDRVFGLLDRRPKAWTPDVISRPTQADGGFSSTPNFRGSIEFDSVTFFYPTRPQMLALDSVGLSIGAGERVALVGPSGAGKTTIVNLLLGFYTPASGLIKFDGVDALRCSLSDIRRNIAIVEQEPALFSTSIMENIRYGALGETISDEEVIEAAIKANVHDFVSEFPRGYATVVGNRGTQLSGGQKQRIAIARALLRSPRILILDEATSALDTENEIKVQSALGRLMENCTTIIVAHRFSTVAYADRLIVMKEGRIVQSGTHNRLMENREGVYYQLMNKQAPSQMPVSVR